jgi:hypothetical protein
MHATTTHLRHSIGGGGLESLQTRRAIQLQAAAGATASAESYARSLGKVVALVVATRDVVAMPKCCEDIGKKEKMTPEKKEITPDWA